MHIEEERERVRERKKEIERERERASIYIYIYIYICVCEIIYKSKMYACPILFCIPGKSQRNEPQSCIDSYAIKLQTEELCVQ